MTQTNNLKLSLPEGSDKVDVGVLRTNFTALDGVLGQHAASINQALAAVGSRGKNCRVMWGSYAGTGGFGAANPTVFISGFTPALVFSTEFSGSPGLTCTFYRDSNMGSAAYGKICHLTWGSDRMSMYNEESGNYQCNRLGMRYDYMVFGFDP